MLLSFGFVLSWIILGVMMMLTPKREEKLSFSSWIVMVSAMIWAIWVFVVGWMSVFKVYIGLESLLLVNLLLSGLLLGWILYKRKVQSYEVSWPELGVVFLFLVVAYLLVVVRQGGQFNIFHYEADDSARHLEYAINLFYSHQLNIGRFALYLLNAIVMWVIAPFVDAFELYKAFSLCDVFMLFLSFGLLWVWFRSFAHSAFLKVLSVILAVVVTLGFIWNIILFGFGYLVTGVVMVIFLMVVLENLEREKITLRETIFLLMLINTVITVSYSLFAPAVYVGEAIYFILYLRAHKKILSLETLLLGILGVGLPLYICVHYIANYLLASYRKVLVTGFFAVLLVGGILWCIVQVFLHKKNLHWGDIKRSLEIFLENHKFLRLFIEIVFLGVLLLFVYKYIYIGLLLRFMAISKPFNGDGSIYRNPYGDFMLLLFPIVIYIVNCIRARKNDALMWMFFATVGFSCWIIRYILYGQMGTYYFYKMHFMLWPLAWAMVFKVIASLKKESFYYAGIYAAMVLGLFGLFMTGKEKKFNEYSYFLWPNTMLEEFFGIYDYNMILLKSGGTLSEELLEASRESYHLCENENTFIPLFGNEVKYYKDYYYVLSGQNRYDHPHWLFDENAVSDNIVASLKEIGADYICVKYDYFEYDKLYADEFMLWDMVWTNMDYAIYKVPDELRYVETDILE